MWGVPYLTSAAAGSCRPDSPCPHGDCLRCTADKHLTADDWAIVRFYQRVRDQYINQTPMGTEKGAPMVLTLRMEAVESALRIYGYPRETWGWFADGAGLLHRLCHKLERVRWYAETGKDRADLTPEDLSDGV